MDPRLVAFIDKVRSIDDLETMRTVFSKTAASFGFDSFAYLAVHIVGKTEEIRCWCLPTPRTGLSIICPMTILILTPWFSGVREQSCRSLGGPLI